MTNVEREDGGCACPDGTCDCGCDDPDCGVRDGEVVATATPGSDGEPLGCDCGCCSPSQS